MNKGLEVKVVKILCTKFLPSGIIETLVLPRVYRRRYIKGDGLTFPGSRIDKDKVVISTRFPKQSIL